MVSRESDRIAIYCIGYMHPCPKCVLNFWQNVYKIFIVLLLQTRFLNFNPCGDLSFVRDLKLTQVYANRCLNNSPQVFSFDDF